MSWIDRLMMKMLTNRLILRMMKNRLIMKISTIVLSRMGVYRKHR